MPKKQNKYSKYSVILKTAIMEVSVTVFSMLIFSIIMLLAEIKYEYSSLFATLSVANGLLVSTYYTARKRGSKGLLTGLINGSVTFLAVLIIAFILDNGSLTYNTFFHFIIFILSAITGGISGVNKTSSKKYI